MFKDFPRMVKSEDYFEAAREMSLLRQVDKTWTKQASCICDFESFKIKEGQFRYTINYNKIPFECLFLPDKSKKLYVAFSGGGTRLGRKYPLFLRWKYKGGLDGNMLFIDDPMYYFHPEFPYAMWYYGTNQESYLCYVLELVNKFIEILEIQATDVVFMGSSAGGYAALYCANRMSHSSAIAMNPQTVLKDWMYPTEYEHFIKMGIDLNEDDLFNRNKILLTNKNSRFFIVMNIKSSKEYYHQFLPFLTEHELKPKLGISQKSNIVTWIHETDYSDPHSALPLRNEIVMIDYLLEKMKTDYDMNELSNVSIWYNEVMYEQYDLKTKLENSDNEKSSVYTYMNNLISEIMERVLSDCLKRKDYLIGKSQYELSHNTVTTHMWKNGHMGYYIGEQKTIRYNILWYKRRFYLRLLVDDFDKNIMQRDEFKNSLEVFVNNKEITRWRIEENGTLVVVCELQEKNSEAQMLKFVELTLGLLDKHAYVNNSRWCKRWRK